MSIWIVELSNNWEAVNTEDSVQVANYLIFHIFRQTDRPMVESFWMIKYYFLMFMETDIDEEHSWATLQYRQKWELVNTLLKC